jgi:hypothetical protein
MAAMNPGTPVGHFLHEKPAYLPALREIFPARNCAYYLQRVGINGS